MNRSVRLEVRMDSESLKRIERLSIATNWTYGDIVRNALNLAYDWDIPLTYRKGQINNLPGD